MSKRPIPSSKVVFLLLVITSGAISKGDADVEEAPPPLPEGESEKYCKEGGVMSTTDVEGILKAINEIRTKVGKGEQPNGPRGRRLPVAVSPIPPLNWSCQLENDAKAILEKAKCREDSLADPPNNTYFYISDKDDLQAGPPFAEIAEKLMEYLALANTVELTVEDDGSVKYKGEGNITHYVNLIRPTTTQIGCSAILCGKNIDQPEGRSLICITDSLPPKEGEILYKGVPTACQDTPDMTNSIRRAFLNKHNMRRSQLALGAAYKGTSGFCKTATKMPQLVYDCDLEKAAYEQAKNCKKANRLQFENFHKVKHIFAPLEKAAELAVQRWWSELKTASRDFCKTQSLHSGTIKAFANLASDLTTKVGCGIYNCSTTINAVCHYKTSVMSGKEVYTMSTKPRGFCTQCPRGSSCRGGFPGLCSSTASGVKLR